MVLNYQTYMTTKTIPDGVGNVAASQVLKLSFQMSRILIESFTNSWRQYQLS